MTAEHTVAIASFLADEGFRTDASAAAARAALEAAGITRDGKTGMSSLKLERAREALDGAIARWCGREACEALLELDRRRAIVVDRGACEVCGGSNNQRAVREMVTACRRAGVRHLLVVGGTPRLRDALSGELGGGGPDLRFVSGTEKAPNQRAALLDCTWADLVVVWAPTPLPHKVSDLYAAAVCDADHVEVHRRGIEALAAAVSDHLDRVPGRRVRRR